MRNLSLTTFVLSALVTEGETGTYEFEEKGHYENCMVAENVDLFTDDRRIMLLCHEIQEDGNITAVSVVLNHKGEYSIAFTAGEQANNSSPIAIVMWRVDKGELHDFIKPWEPPGWAIDYEHPLEVTEFLEAIANGKRLILRVGAKVGIINLNGAAEAVKDFVERVSALYPSHDARDMAIRLGLDNPD